MRPETGNKTPEFTKRVSIQLSLGGHSFSAPALTGDFPDNAPVEVELLTPRTMLVPAELFDQTRAEALLSANGMPAEADECVVCSDPDAEIIALMAMNGEALRQVNEKLGLRAQFTTPLLHEPNTDAPTVWIRRTAELIYIKVYDGTLRLAEVIPAADDTDILYFFERLSSEFSLADYTLCIAGDNPKTLRKLLGNRFNRTICE